MATFRKKCGDFTQNNRPTLITTLEEWKYFKYLVLELSRYKLKTLLASWDFTDIINFCVCFFARGLFISLENIHFIAWDEIHIHKWALKEVVFYNLWFFSGGNLSRNSFRRATPRIPEVYAPSDRYTMARNPFSYAFRPCVSSNDARYSQRNSLALHDEPRKAKGHPRYEAPLGQSNRGLPLSQCLQSLKSG